MGKKLESVIFLSLEGEKSDTSVTQLMCKFHKLAS